MHKEADEQIRGCLPLSRRSQALHSEPREIYECAANCVTLQRWCFPGGAGAFWHEWHTRFGAATLRLRIPSSKLLNAWETVCFTTQNRFQSADSRLTSNSTTPVPAQCVRRNNSKSTPRHLGSVWLFPTLERVKEMSTGKKTTVSTKEDNLTTDTCQRTHSTKSGTGDFFITVGFRGSRNTTAVLAQSRKCSIMHTSDNKRSTVRRLI